MNTAGVCAVSAAAMRIHAITARASFCWRARPSPSGNHDHPGVQLVSSVHRLEIGRVVRYEDIAVTLNKLTELGVVVTEHATIAVAGCLQPVVVCDLPQGW